MATKNETKKETKKVTKKATKKETVANSEDAASAENDKKNKIAKKLETLGVMGSAKKAQKTGSNTFASMLLAIIVAIPAGMLVVYIAMPDQLNGFLPSSTTANNAGPNQFYVQPGMQGHPYSRNQNQVPAWVAMQREQMEKRRAEFNKRNENLNSVNRSAAEPPQWVKDQQARMQKEQEKYQQEWAKRSSEMSNNGPQAVPGYMNNRGMNGYPQNQAPVYSQNPAPYYNGYAPPVNSYQYSNSPYNAPQNMRYGQNIYSR